MEDAEEFDEDIKMDEVDTSESCDTPMCGIIRGQCSWEDIEMLDTDASSKHYQYQREFD